MTDTLEFVPDGMAPSGKRGQFIYRAYDIDGALLYVGRTARPLQRKAEHMCRADWAGRAYEWRITGPFTPAEAATLEADFIKALNPEANVAHRVEPKHVTRDSGSKALGEAIKQARLDRGVKQFHLATRIGVSHTYLCNIERGHRGATTETLKVIADELRIDVATLLFLQGRP